MEHDSTQRSGPWRLLVLDRSEPGDPRWLLATVTEPAHVRPAAPAEDQPDEVTARWAIGQHGQPATITPLARAKVWSVDGRSK
jgi:hypothetical protein